MNTRAGKAELHSQQRRMAQSLSGRMVDGLGQAVLRKSERRDGSVPRESFGVRREHLVGQSVKDAPAPDSQTTSGAGNAAKRERVPGRGRTDWIPGKETERRHAEQVNKGYYDRTPPLSGDKTGGIPAAAPDSPNHLETGVEVPEINGGIIRATDHPFFDFGGYIYPGKANPTTTTTTESRVCVVSLVSMLLLLLLNYWLSPKLLNGVEADGSS